MKTFTLAGVIVSAGAFVALAQHATVVGPSVNPTAVAKRAAVPPPADAAKTTTAGKDKLRVVTSNSATDDDSYWVEEIDVDGDGNVEKTDMVWDDEDRVLFAYTDGSFRCMNGGTGSGGVLVAVNGTRNPRHKPAGSGFWIADLDKDECAAQAAGLWGCRFDASGKATVCEAAVIDAKLDRVIAGATAGGRQ
jgi:hypothetical protein